MVITGTVFIPSVIKIGQMVQNMGYWGTDTGA